MLERYPFTSSAPFQSNLTNSIGTSEKKLDDAQEELLKISGIGHDQFKMFKVGFEFDQNYVIQPEGVPHEEMKDNASIGSFKAMELERNIDPYTGKKLKPKKQHITRRC